MSRFLLIVGGLLWFSLASCCLAEENSDIPPAILKSRPLPELGTSWKPLTKPNSPQKVWIEPKQKLVAVDGSVCLTRGYLELFACVANTKEHESVVALQAKAQLLHTALLAVGAKPGHPARWGANASYRPATGQTIEVMVEWMEGDKKQNVKAQEWVRDLKTRKAMAHDWVFGGSSMWKDPETKKTYYRADGGEAICVSNFPVAMLDIPVESSQANEELAFEAFTERIPPRGTPVRVTLRPKPTKQVERRETQQPKSTDCNDR